MHAAGPQANAVCYVWDRSKTFKGVRVSKPPCVAACAGEGYPNGFCFLDVAAPDHRVCMCTGPCSPPELATTMRKMVLPN